MAVAPGLPTGIHAVRVRRHTWPWHDGVFAQGLAGLVLHMHHAIPHHLTATLQHPQDGRSCLCSGLVQRLLTPLLCHACLFPPTDLTLGVRPRGAGPPRTSARARG